MRHVAVRTFFVHCPAICERKHDAYSKGLKVEGLEHLRKLPFLY